MKKQKAGNGFPLSLDYPDHVMLSPSAMLRINFAKHLYHAMSETLRLLKNAPSG